MSSGNLMRQRGFLRLVIGSAAATLGDQFTMIAIPWLVLRLTHDSLILGTVVACIGFPRVALLLLAGALVDRYSPRSVLMAAWLVSSLLLVAFGALLLTHVMSVHWVYVFAAALGVVGAFAFPARMAILPRLVEPTHLQAANSMMMSVSQGAVLLGPVVAGLLSSTTQGLAVAFVLDGCCFLLAALNVPQLTLSVVSENVPNKHLVASMIDGVKWLFGDLSLRTLTCYWAMATLIASGPVQIGLPVLVEQQLGLGSAAFGLLISVSAGGQLAGVALSGLKLLRALPLGIVVCLIDLAAGLAMLGMGINRVLAISVALVLVLGIGIGFVQVSLYTWIQHRIPKHMLGRIISMLSLIMTSIAPLSALLTGVLTHYISVPQLFVLGGMLLSGFALVAVLTSRTIRSVQVVS